MNLTNNVSGRIIAGIFAVLLGAALTFALSASTASAQVAPTCTINANPSSVSYSGSSYTPVVLTWSSSNATSANLTNVGTVATNGSQTFYPSVTTTYILTVTGSGGSTNCQTTVYVSGSSGTPSCSIYANPSNINYGGYNNYSTLTWNSTNATSANLTNLGSVATNGSQNVYPTVTTTYILNVYNAQGQSSQCQTTVTVGGGGYYGAAPTCWITLSNYNNTYNYNQPTTLSWGSTNATSANISPNIGSISTSGSQTVYPSGNQIYTMTVYNSQGQSATCQTSQYYQGGQGNLSCNIYANPITIQNGKSSYLTWNSTGATSAWLSDGLGNVASNGSITVRPESSRTYTLTVTNYQGQTQTCNAYVTVSGSYPYISLTQIPYTGFDFGTTGNILYWIALALFALAAGYLVVYHLPGRGFRMPTFALAGTSKRAASERISVPAIFSSAKGGEESAVIRKASIAVPAALEKAAVVRTTATASRDSMDFAQAENGAPRIVITRN